ncbi:MAG TPA: DegT/DnrJ/EryC1/StrS family aminotransferase [Solirubrobacterales bacterium]|nr:DegT/DnrJ/EryC1/StrS family aminotransferase [Solirubrobacterales bacterium]
MALNGGEGEVPLFATREALAPLLPEVADRQRRVLESGRYVLGPEVEAFEAELAAWAGAGHAVGVASGTDALTIALRALGIGPGDEVVVPALTFYATAEAVIHAGAVPVLCDVDPDTLVVTAATAEPAIGPRTKALLPVHLFGNPAPMGELRQLAEERGLRLLEDAAQATGARLEGMSVGCLGDAAAFSFFPSKNLGGFGDGGAIVSDDEEVGATARRLRAHGSEDRVLHTEVGYNSRLDELQAAGLRVLLPHLEEWTRERRRVAARYAESELGRVVRLPVETPGGSSCHHLYVVRCEERERLAAGLRERGIGARAYYTVPLHRQPGLAGRARFGELPAAERAAAEMLALPMGPALSDSQVAAVATAAVEVLGG